MTLNLYAHVLPTQQKDAARSIGKRSTDSGER